MSEEEEWVPEAADQEENDEEHELSDKDENEEEEESVHEEGTTTAATATAARPNKRQRTDSPVVAPASSSLIPESLVDFIMTKLQQDGDENQVSETLLQLARVFREQAALCLFQAERLDRLALQGEDEEPDVADIVGKMSNESSFTRLQRQNVESLVGQSADIMLQCQDTLDSIESSLVPWEQKLEKIPKPQYYKNSYTLYSAENFDTIASRLGTSDFKVVSRELGKSWKALSEEEKQVYKKRMREINQQGTPEIAQGIIRYEK